MEQMKITKYNTLFFSRLIVNRKELGGNINSISFYFPQTLNLGFSKIGLNGREKNALSISIDGVMLPNCYF